MKRLIAAVIPLAAAVALAAPAQADQYSFIDALERNGVSYGGDYDVAMEMGSRTCYDLRYGRPVPDILDAMVEVAHFAEREAAIVLAASSVELCPDTMPIVNQFVVTRPKAKYAE